MNNYVFCVVEFYMGFGECDTSFREFISYDDAESMLRGI